MNKLEKMESQKKIEEQLIAKISVCQSVQELKNLYPDIIEGSNHLITDESSERVLEMYSYAMRVIGRNPSEMYQIPVFAKFNNQQRKDELKNRKVKTLAELLTENPNHLDNVILDNKMNLYHNSQYFFEQADVPALLAFLETKDIKIEMRGDKVLEKSLKALSHFLHCYNDYKRDFDRLAKQKLNYNHMKQSKITTEKQCTKCLKVKSIHEFRETKGKKPKILAKCKQCYLEYEREYREKNREKVNLYSRNYIRLPKQLITNN